MSLNLVFTKKNLNGKWDTPVVDFPYQTRTDVTTAVIKAKTVSDQMAILEKDVYENYTADDPGWSSAVLTKIEQMLKDPNLVLGIT